MRFLPSILTAAALTLAAAPASATSVNHDTPEAEILGSLCEAGDNASCDRLVALTAGHCAGPAWSQCQYSSTTMLAVDNGLMAWVPGYGHSRIETIQVCLEDAGVSRFQDLITDSHFETFGRCLEENT
jgi:hypothetical protein